MNRFDDCMLWFVVVFFILWTLFCLEAVQSVMLPISLGYRVQLGKHCSFSASLFSLQSLSLQQLVSSTEKSQARLYSHVAFPLLCKDSMFLDSDWAEVLVLDGQELW